jgi:hypothetical protein
LLNANSFKKINTKHINSLQNTQAVVQETILLTSKSIKQINNNTEELCL